MKKIIILLFTVLFITSCGTKYELKNDLIKTNMEELQFENEEKEKEHLFSGLTYLTSEDMKNNYQFDTKYFDEFIIAMPMINIKSSMYMVLKVKEGKLTEAKNELAGFDEKYAEQWKLYLPDQAELVKNKLQTEKGNYLIYIISNDNNLALKTILNSK